jgi:hypothetical protein
MQPGRGGFSTKLHLCADAEERPVARELTGGERHDRLGVDPPVQVLGA